MNKTDERRLVEASAWRTYLTERDLDSDAAFEGWLAQDIRNRRAWDHVQSSWDFFGEQATAPELLDLRRSALAKARCAGRRRWTSSPLSVTERLGVRGALAACAALIVVAAAVTWNVLRADVYLTDAGERRVVTLTDGSKVELDSSTELRVSYSDRSRELTLKHGQARFDVARDLERPFSVLAGGRKVLALGTAFNVDMLGKDLLVTLIEGRVVILPKDAPAPHPAQAPAGSAAKSAAGPIELAAGQQLSISETGASRINEANVQRATAWQSGRLMFDDEPLSRVIERVNRYAARPVILDDEQTAELKISGVFNTGDVEGFVSTITHYLPVDAEEGTDAIRLSHR